MLALWLVFGAVVVAQFDLRRTERFAALESTLSRALGLELRTGPVRLDLVTAQGLVIHDFALRLGSFELRIPRAVVRPTWSSLDGPELRPAIHARGFTVEVDAESSAEAFLRLKELLELAHFPDAKLDLSQGSVRLRNGDEVMRGIRFRLDGTVARPTLRARAMTRRGGRLDLRGERDAQGVLFVHAYPEGLPVADVPSWLQSAGIEMPSGWELPEVPVAVTGRWHLALAPDDSASHDFDLALEGNVVPIALDISGNLRTRNHQFVPGSHVRAAGRVGRLRGASSVAAGADQASMLVSGPLLFEVSPSGAIGDPRIEGLLQLDDAHLRVSNRLRKVCGVPARIHFTSAPLSGVRVSTLGLELGALRVRAHQTGDGPARAESDWVAFKDLAGIFPALKGRASGGRVRIASALLEGIDRIEGQIEFDDVELAGRRMPLRIEGVAGFAAVGSGGFHAEDLRGSVAGIPMKASLEVRVGDKASAGPQVFLDVDAPEIDLAKLGIDLPGASREHASGDELSPEAVVAAAEGPVTLLRQQRARVDDVVVERARVRIGRLRSGRTLVRQLDLVLALRSLRLELKRAHFNIGKRKYHYAGTIDLNPLVPEVRIAASP